MAHNPYDELPYPSHAFAWSLPETLALLARMFGLDAPDPTTARVLEIGCAGGGNLVPMAARYPDATFLGIDLSARQIAAARDLAERCHTPNVLFEALDLTALPEDLGPFDYILCHGVFSWVPVTVQEALLAAIGRHLTPDGLAYLSYNVLPGWQTHGAIRDLMLAAAETGPERPLSRVGRARALLSWLTQAVPDEQVAWQATLQRMDRSLGHHSDAYIAHEFLEADNRPIRFLDMVARLHAHGLDYLGESGLTAMLDQYLPPELSTRLRAWSDDLYEHEQYLDDLRNRAFRQSVLTRRGRAADRDLHRFSAAGLYVACRAETHARPDGVVRVGTEEVHVDLEPGLTADAARALAAAWPATLPFEALPGAHDPVALSHGLLSLASLQLVSFHLHPLPTVRYEGGRPTAWHVTRAIARRSSRTTTPRHESVELDTFDHRLVQLLDGTRDANDLVATLAAVTDAHEAATGQPHPHAPITAALVRDRLTRLASWGVLVDPNAPPPGPLARWTPPPPRPPPTRAPVASPAPAERPAARWPGESVAEAHPDRLLTQAWILGVDVRAEAPTARVLDLGCGPGVQLAALAESLPEATLVGVDVDGAQIDRARAALRAVGRPDVALHAADARDVDLGPFDVVLAHNLLGFTPPDHAPALLASVRRHLAPGGVALIAAPCLPGWYPWLAARDLLRFHVRRAAPEDRVRAARALLRDLHELIESGAEPLIVHLAELDAITSLWTDERFEVELLSDEVHPVRLDDLWPALADAGLAVLDEARPSEGDDALYPAPVRAVLSGEAARWPDPLWLARLRDWIAFRAHRATVVVRAEDAPAHPGLRPERLAATWVRADHGPIRDPDTAPWVRTAAGRPVPLLDDADRELARLLDEAAPRALPASALPGDLAHAWRCDRLDLRSHPSPFAEAPPARPRAPALARALAPHRMDVPTLHADAVLLPDEVRRLLPWLDGTRSGQDAWDTALPEHAGDVEAAARVLEGLWRVGLLGPRIGKMP